MASQPVVFIVEDVLSLAETYRAFLRPEGFDVRCFELGSTALAALDSVTPQLIFLDVQLPDINGLDLLRQVKERELKTEVVILTGQGSIKLAVDAMREGAFDFVVKPCTADRLRTTARNAIGKRDIPVSESKAGAAESGQFVDFVGDSPHMQTVYGVIKRVAATNATVFIKGESGTGKELCARAIHQRSNRADGPLITLNCAAIPRDLMESELFGHVKGAFTGASADRNGAALLANGGTLFLDEICEIDISLQSKLLRFLQEKTIQRVGENILRPTDARVICATNRDPMVEMAAGRFREDLFYRVHVVPIELPPLRQRERDCLLIARQFLINFSKEDGKHFRKFSPEAERALLAYNWPGNVRQLQNVVRNIVVLYDGEVVEAEMLPKQAYAGAALGNIVSPSTSADAQASRDDRPQGSAITAMRLGSGIVPLEEIIRGTIEGAIAACAGSIPRAAGMLQVSPSTIYRRVQMWQTESGAGDPDAGIRQTA
jgi:two-component system, repressor protein LuxO